MADRDVETLVDGLGDSNGFAALVHLRERLIEALMAHDAFGCGCCAFVDNTRVGSGDEDDRKRAEALADCALAICGQT